MWWSGVGERLGPQGEIRGKAVAALLVGLGLVPGAALLPPRTTPAGNVGSFGNEGSKGAAARPGAIGRNALVPASFPRPGFADCRPCPSLGGCLVRTAPAAGMAAHAPHGGIACAPCCCPPSPSCHPNPASPRAALGGNGETPSPPAPVPSTATAQPAAEPPYCPRSRFDLPRSRGRYHRRGPGAAPGVRQVQPHISG